MLADKTTLLTLRIGNEMTLGESFFIVVSVPVCKISKEKRTKVCKENHQTACDNG